MPVDNYETSTTEVSRTNELLEEQNIKIDNFNSTVSILLFAVLFFKAGEFIHRIFVRFYKY